MLTDKECTRSADLCDRLAFEAEDKAEKAILLSMATQWRRLANLKKKKRRKSDAADEQAKDKAAN
jgi:hypothetical protein